MPAVFLLDQELLCDTQEVTIAAAATCAWDLTCKSCTHTGALPYPPLPTTEQLAAAQKAREKIVVRKPFVPARSRQTAQLLQVHQSQQVSKATTPAHSVKSTPAASPATSRAASVCGEGTNYQQQVVEGAGGGAGSGQEGSVRSRGLCGALQRGQQLLEQKLQGIKHHQQPRQQQQQQELGLKCHGVGNQAKQQQQQHRQDRQGLRQEKQGSWKGQHQQGNCKGQQHQQGRDRRGQQQQPRLGASAGNPSFHPQQEQQNRGQVSSQPTSNVWKQQGALLAQQQQQHHGQHSVMQPEQQQGLTQGTGETGWVDVKPKKHSAASSKAYATMKVGPSAWGATVGRSKQQQSTESSKLDLLRTSPAHQLANGKTPTKAAAGAAAPPAAAGRGAVASGANTGAAARELGSGPGAPPPAAPTKERGPAARGFVVNGDGLRETGRPSATALPSIAGQQQLAGGKGACSGTGIGGSFPAVGGGAGVAAAPGQHSSALPAAASGNGLSSRNGSVPGIAIQLSKAAVKRLKRKQKHEQQGEEGQRQEGQESQGEQRQQQGLRAYGGQQQQQASVQRGQAKSPESFAQGSAAAGHTGPSSSKQLPLTALDAADLLQGLCDQQEVDEEEEAGVWQQDKRQGRRRASGCLQDATRYLTALAAKPQREIIAAVMEEHRDLLGASSRSSSLRNGKGAVSLGGVGKASGFSPACRPCLIPSQPVAGGKKAQSCLAAAAAALLGTDDQSWSGCLLAQLPAELLQTILVLLSKSDIASLSLTCRAVKSCCDDGAIWQELLASHYPHHRLTASQVCDIKYAYILEAHSLLDGLRCWVTHLSFEADVLGLPIRWHYRRGMLQYVELFPDLISLTAFKAGVRTTSSGVSA